MQKFAGIFPYLVSPVNDDGSVREKVLRDLVEYLISCKVHGLVPLGSTGEFFYLNFEQKKEIVKITIEQTAKRIPVIAGVAASSVIEAIYQAKQMQDLGVDGIVAILNVYFPLNQNGIYTYFSEIAKAVDCPVVIYNNPKFTGYEIEIETLVKLSKIDNIQYYKDASGNTGKLLTLLNRTGDDLTIFSASAHVPTFVMMLGGAGWMAGPSCVIPKQSVELYEFCVQKKWEEAMELQKKLWKINSVFQKYGLAACIKGALQLQGFDVGDPIPPITALSREGRQEIELALKNILGENYRVL